MRALQLTTTASMIDQFIIPYIDLLISMGYDVDTISDYSHPGNISHDRSEDLQNRLKAKNVKVFDTPIPRSLNPVAMVKAYKLVKNQIVSAHYDLINCHSPIGAAICRLAAKSERKNGTKVIYTAHGFHFYTGAPLMNWLIYYPVEKWLSRYTDVLVTINKEDYARAKAKFHALRTEYIPGIGIDMSRFNSATSDDALRQELGIEPGSIMMLSVGELNKNKNHEVVIRAMKDLPSNIRYVIVGRGPLKDNVQALIDSLGLSDRVMLTGYRDDVARFYAAADLFVFPSHREGLSVALMEAMASGLPVVCGNIRGNTDLIEDGKGGYLFDPSSSTEVKDCIVRMLNGDMKKMGDTNAEVIKGFDLPTVRERMTSIYRSAVENK